MKNNLQKLMAFSLNDWQVLFEAYFLIFALKISLRCCGFSRVYYYITKQRLPLVGYSHEKIEKLCYLVRLSCQYHFCRAQCLHYALVAYYLLRQRGVEVDLCIGVRREGSDMAAHAWLEFEGRAIQESPETQKTYLLLMRC